MNAVGFDCGDCIPVNPGQTVQSVIDDHAGCSDCEEHAVRILQDQIDIVRERGHKARQKKWEASVDAALAKAKEAS